MVPTLSSTSYNTTGSVTVHLPLSRICPAGKTRQPVDCRQPLTQASDHGNPPCAQLRYELAFHNSRPRVQQVMRLSAPSGRLGEQVEIGPHQIRGIEGGVLTVVAAEDDDVMIRAGVE